MMLTTVRPAASRSRRAARAVDPRVLAANRMAAELLAEEAERSSSPMFKFLAWAATAALSLTMWWIATKLTLKI